METMEIKDLLDFPEIAGDAMKAVRIMKELELGGQTRKHGRGNNSYWTVA